MTPHSRMDKIIGTYIETQVQDDFHNILSEDERLEIALYLSELANGLLGWYPFQNDSRILQIGSWFGAFSSMLSLRSREVVIVEDDSYRAYMTKKRLKGLSNIQVIQENTLKYCEKCSETFDYIIFAVDEQIDVFPDAASYIVCIEALKTLLKEEGKLLLAVPNRLGVKYFCGVPDPYTKIRFDGITEKNSGLFRFDREELLRLMQDARFPYVKMYYPMSDHHYTQVIYTDDYRPNADVMERIHIYMEHKEERFLYECELVKQLAQNGVLHCFTNSFLVEAGNTPCSSVIYAALSTERDRARAFATNIYDNQTVEKIPLYPDGRAGLENLLQNTQELSQRGIPVLAMEEKENAIWMERINAPSLSQYLQEAVRENVKLFTDCMDRLYNDILKSSEHVSAEKNCMRHLAPEKDWGVILKKAYIEMIPVNSFWKNGDILFYDQEFTRENCPANYVLFRALRDIYTFSPEIEEKISLEKIKDKYGLSETWDFYAREEERFQTELRRRNLYCGFYPWVKHLFQTVQENRRQLDVSEDKKKYDYFNPFSNLDDRRIVLFGAGRMAGHYLNRYKREYPPVFIVDNNQNLWGSKKENIEIKAPEAILRLMPGTYRVVITMGNYEPIVSQLESMGIGVDSYRIFTREMDALLSGKLVNPMSDGKYHIGYVTGVFDLFHIGHLNLLRNCKSRCHYLVAGVLTDELTKHDKNKTPFISFEERMEIVSQCKYVDRVIPVDFHNTNKVDAWKELRYGCLFSGSDHKGEPYWVWLQRQLQSLGSELEFFPYTQSTSSTMLQAAIREEVGK